MNKIKFTKSVQQKLDFYQSQIKLKSQEVEMLQKEIDLYKTKMQFLIDKRTKKS